MRQLTVGNTKALVGDITTLQWIKPGHEFETEQGIGFHHGRLAQGYWVCVLIQKPEPGDFEFAGTTLRSGGREGLPERKPEADAARPLIREQMILEHGQTAYDAMRKKFMTEAQVKGPNRLAKVIPVIPHSERMPADLQYPMGGGGLQWSLTKEATFMVALFVAPNGKATAPSFSVNLRTGGYDARARVRQMMTSI